MRSDATDTLIGTVALDATERAILEDGGIRRLLLDPVSTEPAEAWRELVRNGVQDGDTIQIRALRQDDLSEPAALLIVFEGIVG